MELEFRLRNNDLGQYIPTRQERMNSVKSAEQNGRTHVASAAPALSESAHPVTPHLLNDSEVEQTLKQMETEATQQNEALLAVHSGLNEQRVARLLGLLD